MEIKNKVAIITGGIGGIGFVTTQFLLRNEIKFVGILDILEINNERAQKNLSILEQEFGKNRFGYYKCDVRDHEEFKASYEQVFNLKEYVDILINNAGVIADIDIDKNIDINFKAVVKGTLMAIEHMSKEKGGVIVNIGSTAGLVNRHMTPIYNASKHAVVSFVRSMKKNCKTLGVRVVCICPHFTDTNLFHQWEKFTLSFVNSHEMSDLKKIFPHQNPENVAAAVVEIIKKGHAGDVWLVADNKPPCGIREIDESSELTYDL